MNDDGLGNTTSKSKEIKLKIKHEHKKKWMNVEHDRLSSLPDDLIHKILSFIDIKRVVQTSVLSSRWRFVWTSTPYLNFSVDHSFLPNFSNIVEHVLSGRNNEIDIYSVKLGFRGEVTQVFVKRILNYAFSHNVQEMSILSINKQIEFPFSLFNCQSLKHLTLGGLGHHNSLTATSTLKLASLTTLHLKHVILNDDNSDSYIAKCVNLKSLTLNRCQMMGSSGGFTICHPQLLSFTLIFGYGVVKIIAPKLTYISLNLLSYGRYNNNFPCFMNGLPSLEEVDIRIHGPDDASKIFNMLKQFSTVKYLTINLEIVECLSSSVYQVSNQPSPFSKLETLKIHPVREILEGQTQKRVVDVSTVIKSYFLDSSPRATLSMVSREEVKAVKSAKLALECIPKVQVLLDELKTDLDKQKTIMEIHKENMHHHDDDKEKAKVNLTAQPSMKQIHICWKDLSRRISCEEKKLSHIFSELKNIEELLTYVPASKKVKMQASFACMCEEADSLMKKILKRTKIVCDIKEFHLSDYFKRLIAKALHPSS